MRAEPISVDVLVQSAGWRRGIPGAAQKARRAAGAALAALRSARAGEITIVLADDAAMRKLNRSYRGKDKPTNVLSFALQGTGPGEPIGDVVLALETVLGEAEAQGKKPGDHFVHLVIHGVLHLFGHDHQRAAPARRMETLEVKLLDTLGIADPYRARPVRDAERRSAGRRGAERRAA